jgi:1-acyl-sn-glycerol-3-phosphate acyltransferase
VVPRQTKLRKPGHGEKLGFWWRLTWVVLYAPFGMLTKLRYHHLERLPATGPAIVIVNHISHVDPMLVARFVLDAGRVPRFLAKESIFRVRLVGRAMNQMGHIPVMRGTSEAGESLTAAVEALRMGRIILLHPEGTVTRDPDWWPMSARTGAARLALLAPDVPVIPLGQWGVQDAVDLYRKRVRLIPRREHHIIAGEPLDLAAFEDAKPTVETLRSMTDAMMGEVRTLVAGLRGVPAPTGPFFRYARPAREGGAKQPRDAA